MSTDLATLVTPMTTDEAKEAIYAALTARGVTTTSWKPGAVVRTIVAALAVALSALSWMQAQLAKMGFLEYAEEDWLTLVARYVYGVERIAGTFASGTIVASNADGGVYSGGAEDLIVSSSITGKEYRSTGAWSIGAGESGVVIPVRAVELGSGSSAEAGEIDTLVTVLAGVSVTNPTALVGDDVETDAALRVRCREKTGALSPNGPADAYAYFARSATLEDGSSAGVTRIRVVPDGQGNVTVYVASASGPLTGTVGDLTTPIGAIDDAIQRNVVPLCVTATVVSVSAVTVAVTYEAWIRASTGLASTDVEQAVGVALEEFFATHPIGGEVISPATGKLYVDALRAAIAEALPTGAVVRLTIAAPASDVSLDPDEVAALGLVTCTAVHVVAGEVV